MVNSTYKDLKEIILSKKKALIISHYNPDGDAIGSSFGLANYLNLINIESHVYNMHKVPDYLDFIKTKNFHNSLKNIPIDIDLFLLVDFNDLERSGHEMMDYLNEKIKEEKSIIIIDHHENNKIDYGKHYIDTNASSTGVLIYKLLMEFENNISPEIATSLLATIVTDTSSFKNSNSNSEAFKISADLLELGANLNEINSKIYQLGNINVLQLRNKIHSTLIFENSLKLAICYSKNSFYEETNTTKEDSEGIANGLIFYKDVEIGIFIREIENNKWKASMRTNNFIDLAKFAQLFDGGGHKNASGFTYEGSIEKLINRIIETLRNE